MAGDAIDDRLQNREVVNVPIVVDRLLAIRLQVEGIDHDEVTEIRRGGLIGDVHRMVHG